MCEEFNSSVEEEEKQTLTSLPETCLTIPLQRVAAGACAFSPVLIATVKTRMIFSIV